MSIEYHVNDVEISCPAYTAKALLLSQQTGKLSLTTKKVRPKVVY